GCGRCRRRAAGFGVLHDDRLHSRHTPVNAALLHQRITDSAPRRRVSSSPNAHWTLTAFHRLVSNAATGPAVASSSRRPSATTPVVHSDRRPSINTVKLIFRTTRLAVQRRSSSPSSTV